MENHATIILATNQTELIAALPDTLPDVRILQIGVEPLNIQVIGRTWCFIDWLLPSISGLEVCRRLRESAISAQCHITMVLDEDDSEIRRRVLRAGADDYVTGPLDVAIIANRLGQYQSLALSNAVPRRVSNGSVMLDLGAHQLRYHSKIIHLRPNEFRLLTHFIENPNQLFTRHQLIAKLGKDCGEIDERTVDVWVGRLRRSLKAHGVPDQLRTVRSMGYVLDSVNDTQDAHAA